MMKNKKIVPVGNLSLIKKMNTMNYQKTKALLKKKRNWVMR